MSTNSHSLAAMNEKHSKLSSGHVYQRKQLSKIKFALAASSKQMHIVQKSLHVVIWLSPLKPR